MIKNITFITSYFAPAWGYGGPPKVFYTLSRKLVREGKKVKVITTDAQDEKRNKILQETIEDVEVYRFRTVSNYLAYKAKFLFVPSLLKKTRYILGKSDVVLFSGIRPVINGQVYKFLVDEKIPYGIFAFGQIPPGDGVKAVVKKIFDHFWVRDFVKRASFRFSQTRHEQEMFAQYFNIPVSQIYLLPLPVETIKTIKKKELANNFKKKWAIAEGDLVLLFVGRLHFLKGADLLIKAVKPLLKKNKNLKLLIVGRDDGEEENLVKIASLGRSRQIIFAGPLYEKDLQAAYLTATCFVFTPRHFEETSLACLEALNLGVPVVVTHEAAIPYLEEYKAGFIVKNNPDFIRSAVVKLLNKLDKEKEIIQKNSQKLIKDRFSSQEVTRQLLAILESRKKK